MPPKIVKLGKRDDITYAIKQIKSVKDREVVLEVAAGSLLLTSSDTLRLLKRTAEAMGKTIKVSTDDEVGQILAKKAGVLLGNQDIKMPKRVLMKVARSDIKPKFSDIMSGRKPINKPTVARSAPKPSFEQNFIPASESDSDESVETNQKSNFWKWLVLAVATVIIVLVAGILILPRATITVTARSEQISLDVALAMDQNFTAVNPTALQIPGILVTREVSQTKNFPATGVKLSGTKAIGTVSIYNQTSNTLKLRVATTTLVANGKKFLLVSDVVGIKPGVATPDVKIIADQPGTDYNLAGNTKFQIVNAALGNQNVYAINLTGLSGGAATSTTVVSQNDLDTAAATLADAVVSQAESDLSASAGVTTKLVTSGINKQILAQTANKNVGDVADSFAMTLIAKITGLSFKDSDVNDAVLAKINSVLSSDKYLLNNGQNQYTAVFKSIDLTKGTGVLTVHYQTIAAYKVDNTSLAKLLAGKNAAEIKEILLSKPEIDNVDVKFWPAWFVHSAPQFNGKIYIKTVLAQ